ncbi:ThuA domain-containing protein [Daejeonella sp.]|jgi:type 1 glutamine amidotransferase|uniref:ThuA domain-containing protein n=1 Tax=Daejeonella sp. TaxID=2805397 RepID=UPI0037C056BE
MKHRILCFLILFAISFSVESAPKPKKILVFYKTAAYKHLSIPAGITAISKLGQEHNFLVDTSSNSTVFDLQNLKNYHAIVFLSTSGDMLNNEQQSQFEQYIRSGGGFVGIHGASAGEYDWPWYGKLVGAVFDGHPVQQNAIFKVIDKKHPSTRHFPSEWNMKEELYNFKNINPNINVLLTVDESSYQGGTNGAFHPMAWYHKFEGGRSYYTALGHADDKYTNPLFLKHILEGIRYAMAK